MQPYHRVFVTLVLGLFRLFQPQGAAAAGLEYSPAHLSLLVDGAIATCSHPLAPTDNSTMCAKLKAGLAARGISEGAVAILPNPVGPNTAPFSILISETPAPGAGAMTAEGLAEFMKGITTSVNNKHGSVELLVRNVPYDRVQIGVLSALRYVLRSTQTDQVSLSYTFFRKSSFVTLTTTGPADQQDLVRAIGERVAATVSMPNELSDTFGLSQAEIMGYTLGKKIAPISLLALVCLFVTGLLLIIRRIARRPSEKVDKAEKTRATFPRPLRRGAIIGVLIVVAAVTAAGSLAWSRLNPFHKSFATLGLLPSETLLERHRTVILEGTIDAHNAQDVIAKLFYLQSMDAVTPVTFLIDSTGGDLASILSIRDTMDRLTLPIYTHCLHSADGFATLLLAHGARGHRSAAPSAHVSFAPVLVPREFLEHDFRTGPTATASKPATNERHVPSDDVIGAGVGPQTWTKDGIPIQTTDTPRSLPRTVAATTKPTTERPQLSTVALDLANHTGQTIDAVIADLAQSRTFNATQAKNYGLIDAIQE
jgi:ATP-dependent protease ClpP protease subunit